MNTPDEIITYCLRADGDSAARFYRDLADFTDRLLRHARRKYGRHLKAVREVIGITKREDLRTWQEYAFDFLTIGVLFETWGQQAIGMPRAPRTILTTLARWRQAGGIRQSVADALRGLAGGLIIRSEHGQPACPPLNLETLTQLREWLASTATYDQETARLDLWLDHWSQLPAGETGAALDDCRQLACWFATAAQEALGGYTPNVDAFLVEAFPKYRWRSDAVFCGRQPVEYHRNMVGTEILNRAHRPQFLRTRQRNVLVPPCMRAQPESRCQARPAMVGSLCAGCTPTCRIHQLTKLGEKHGFQVRILPDDLRVYSGGRQPAPGAEETGIVGVSCALTNASGGLETRLLGIAAQGVLLDYCGCSYHWHPTGFPTDVDFDQVLTVMAVDVRRRQHGRRQA